MREIYSQPGTVLIWLGTARIHDGAGVRLIERLWKNLKRAGALQRSASPAFRLAAEGLPENDGEAYAAVHSILQRPWFSRIWIIHEYIMAKDRVFMCGNHRLSSEVALGVAAAAMRESQGLLIATSYQSDTDASSPYLNPYTPHSLEPPHKADENLSLTMMLSLTQNFEVTDPRDRVFGLVGLAKDQAPNCINYAH